MRLPAFSQLLFHAFRRGMPQVRPKVQSLRAPKQLVIRSGHSNILFGGFRHVVPQKFPVVFEFSVRLEVGSTLTICGERFQPGPNQLTESDTQRDFENKPAAHCQSVPRTSALALCQPDKDNPLMPNDGNFSGVDGSFDEAG